MAINVVLKSVFDDKGIKSAVKEFDNFGKGLGVAFAAVGAATAAAGVALARFGMDAVKGAEEAAIAQRRLDQVAQSMGIFGAQAAQVSKRLGEFAEANELVVGVDADVIKSTQAKLLTFKELAATANTVGGAMDRATMAAIDLAAAGFGAAETNAVQLGKALNDPIKGITALTRSGVTFTEEEKKKIKVLVESGQVLEAQNMILSAIETQVGGTAEATASAFTKIELATNQVKDAIGEALLPVFEEFADQVVDITPQLAEALAPAAEQIATIFRERVLPAIQNFTKWLASPQGTQTLKNLTNAVIDAIENFINFTKFVFDNYKTIATLTIGLGALYAAIRLTITGVQLWTAAQLILNSALGPLYLLATVLAGIATGLLLLSANAKKATNELEAAEMRVSGLESELKNLEDAFKSGAIDQAAYKKQTDAVKKALEEARNAVARLNNADLSKFRTQLGDTRVNGQKLANQMRELFFAMEGIKAPKFGDAFTEGDGTGAAVEKAFDKVQKFIKDAQKDLAKAQETYNETIAKAQRKYTDSVTKTERDFQEKLAGIVQQSQDRIRDVFRQAASMSVSDFFNAFKAAEQKRLEAFNQAKEEAEKANKAFTDVFVGTDPVTAYLQSLRNKLAVNRQVLTLSARLFERGFSQVFIEQIIASGQEGGTALGEALLASGPETVSEIQRLFSEINDQAETGMDALAKDIFDKAGFATRELRNLYAKTQSELADALLKLKEDFDAEVLDANKALLEAIKSIRAAFSENIKSMKGDLGGLNKVVKDFMEMLTKAQTDAAKALTPTVPGAPDAGPVPGVVAGLQGVNLAASAVSDATGILIDSASDVAKVVEYLLDRTEAAAKFANRAAIAGQTAEAMSALESRNLFQSQANLLRQQGAGAVGTVININVKTDSTQSLAMVGKTLGNTITKYVQTGGQVVVSPVG